MAKRFLIGLLAVLMLAGIPVAAEAPQELWDYHEKTMGAEMLQHPEAAEWYALALARKGEELTAYREALETYLEQNEVGSASSRLKYALVLVAAGSHHSYIQKTLEDSLGKQGLMSWVFGLHLIQSGVPYEGDGGAVKEKLLSLQLSDGGWAVMGTAGDVDATAMVLQVLAPSYGEHTEALERALDFLSARQLENGGFAAYGAENPESAAQVLTALSALGLDAKTDPRFIKNGNTLFESISRFHLEDGGYAHTLGGSANAAASVQVLCGTLAYSLREEGGFYRFTAVPQPPAAPKGSYKPWAILIIAGAAVIACLVLLLLKRKLREYLLVGAVAVIAVLFVLLTNFQSVEQHYAAKSKENVIGTVQLSIDCGKVREKGDILPQTAFSLAEGETVYDILLEATASNRIHLETSAGYVQGIDNLYEMDHGDLSGWVYRVNGTRPGVSCKDYVLQDGDVIEWDYSLQLGEDLQ